MTDPNKLVRQSAGSYRTGDDRFEVRGEANRWFLVDTTQTDGLGQELIRGPFATLDAVRDAIPEARRAEIKPLPPVKRSASGKAKANTKSKPPPPSWIDKLPKPDATRVRALIRALEREGVEDAEQLVRRDREGLAPEVTRRLIERRLDDLPADLPEQGRPAVRDLIQQVVAVLTVDGTRTGKHLPGWSLVEIGPEPAPPNRRIRIGE
ncbi:hypothetical protein BH23CHL7_BH23CHL7_22420 [soil metagenome]